MSSNTKYYNNFVFKNFAFVYLKKRKTFAFKTRRDEAASREGLGRTPGRERHGTIDWSTCICRTQGRSECHGFESIRFPSRLLTSAEMAAFCLLRRDPPIPPLRGLERKGRSEGGGLCRPIGRKLYARGRGGLTRRRRRIEWKNL